MSGTDPGVSEPHSKLDRLHRITLVVLVGFTFSVFVHYWYSAYSGLRYPHSTYLFRPADGFGVPFDVSRKHCFSDLLAPIIHIRNLDPYHATIPRPLGPPSWFPSNYFPFGAMVAFPLTWIPYDWAVNVFIFGFVLTLLVYNWFFMRTSECVEDLRDVFILTFLTYPAQLLVDRGNLEGVVFLFLALFIGLHVNRRFYLSSLFLGAAIAMKLTPAVFLLLYLRPRQKRYAASCLLAAALLTTGSLLVFRPEMSASIRSLVGVLEAFAVNNTQGLDGTAHGSSLYGLICLSGHLTAGAPHVQAVCEALRRQYPILVMVLLICVILCHGFFRPQMWEEVTLLTLCLILLPNVSPDYRLIHLFLPLALFLNSPVDRSDSIVVSLSFGLLLIPKGFWVIAEDVNIGSIINPILMLVLIAWILVRAKCRARQRQDRPPPPGPARSAAESCPDVSDQDSEPV